MSPDNILKQRASLEKLRKTVAPSDSFFNHPLAYQPKAKGREEAYKDQMVSKKIGTVDLAMNQKKSANSKSVGFDLKNRRSEFKIEPDRNAASLFFSKMPPSSTGKQGRHIADLIIPRNPSLLKPCPIRKDGCERISERRQNSYLGYKGTAKLKINVSQKRKSSFDLGLEASSLKKRLVGSEENDWPSYSRSEIFDEDALIENYPKPSEYALKIDPEENNRMTKKQENFWRELEQSQKNREEIMLQEQRRIAEEAERNTLGTTVKLSFSQPSKKISLEEEETETINLRPATPPLPGKMVNFKFDENAVEEEEEEESISFDERKPVHIFHNKKNDSEMSLFTNNLKFDDDLKEEKFEEYRDSEVSFEDNKNPKKEFEHNLVDLSTFSNDSFKNRQGVSLNVKNAQDQKDRDDREEAIESFLPDYEPLKNYSYFENNNELVLKKENPLSLLANLLNGAWLKKLTKIGKKKNKIVDLEWRSGRESLSSDMEKNDFRFRNSWLGNFLTRQEEKAIMSHFKKSKRGFKRNFLNFRGANSRNSVKVLAFGVAVALSIPLGVFVQKLVETKNKIEVSGQKAFEEVKSAQSAIMAIKPEEANRNFQSAYSEFVSASNSLDEVGGGILSIIKVLPGGSKIKTGENVIEAGKHLTVAGQIMSEAFDLFLGDQGALKKKFITTNSFSDLREVTHQDSLGERKERATSMTDALSMFQTKLDKAKESMLFASASLDRVNIEDLPADKKQIFSELKEKLPKLVQSMNLFSEYSHTILKVLGSERPKQYLFLFENNDEIRATGGFIGTYGLMKVDKGNISQMLIDGIYNPDGQLKERIIPPKPIQKMSATWSMHDANWWPDFPKSAEKVSWFYEKTGGPPVDGVIAFTPKIMEDFLKVIGPINHEKYGTTVTAENFVEITQSKVEKEYDKNLNRPKQFLADLAPLILEKVFSASPEKWIEIMEIFAENLENRSIKIYFFDREQQKLISDLGWSGEMLGTPKDYLSVINTNISGMKTDKMIEQKIDHAVEIKEDGSIVDTVTITRHHRGGKEKYEWYNAVNSNYSRVYVPKGSELLQAEGYTREVNSPPLDYDKLGFIPDEDVLNEEKSTKVDPATGTLVYEDSGKTVFANWTYVSPGETLTLKYIYLLPFKISFDDLKKPADTYSLLIQKQSGDENSEISSVVNGLENFEEVYSYSEKIKFPEWQIKENFSKDIFAGIVLTEKGKSEKFKK